MNEFYPDPYDPYIGFGAGVNYQQTDPDTAIRISRLGCLFSIIVLLSAIAAITLCAIFL